MDYFIDTNIFLRTLEKEGSSRVRDECVNFLRLVNSGKITAVTSNLVLAEMVWTLKKFYKFSKKEIVMTVKSIVNLKLKISDSYQNRVALNLFENKKVKFIDTLIASIPEIKEKKWIVVSYDKDFDKLGIIKKEPKEVVRELEGK